MASRPGRKRKIGVKREPGRAVLDEDLLKGGNGRMTLKRQPKRVVGPLATETGAFDLLEVERRVLRGMMTLRALPDRERRFFIQRSSLPEHVQEQMDAYASVEASVPKFRPTPEDVSQYLTSLSWMRHQTKHMWNIVWWRSFGLSFGIIAEYIGRSDETARRKYKEAIIEAWQAANGAANSRRAA
jgi:hypothetical protein